MMRHWAYGNNSSSSSDSDDSCVKCSDHSFKDQENKDHSIKDQKIKNLEERVKN